MTIAISKHVKSYNNRYRTAVVELAKLKFRSDINSSRVEQAKTFWLNYQYNNCYVNAFTGPALQNKQKLSQTKKTKFIMTTFNIGDAVTFKPNIDSPEKDCVKGIVAEVLENGYYNVTVGLTSFWGSREVKLYGANLYSRV